MQILINTDNHIKAHASLVERVSGVVERAMRRFQSHLTRVEVHLKDENGPKSGAHDQRCLIEARMEHRKPISASHEANTIDQAVDGAIGKLVRALDSDLGRRRDKAGHATPTLPEEPVEE